MRIAYRALTLDVPHTLPHAAHWHHKRCGEVWRTVELLLADAARALGVSDETIRRRLKAGELDGRRDPRGRWIVVLAGESVAVVEAAPHAPHAPQIAPHAPQDGVELLHMRHMLEETRERCRVLEASVDDYRDRLNRAETERAEMRRLLAGAMTVPQLPPASASPEPSRARPWWRRVLGL